MSVKRKSLSFLPALKEVKTTQNNKRPPFFLIDKTTPVFSLSELQQNLKTSTHLKFNHHMRLEERFRNVSAKDNQTAMQNYIYKSYQDDSDKSYAYMIIQSDSLR